MKDIKWVVVTCPVYGILNRALSQIVSLKPEPWRRHALKCLSSEELSKKNIRVILGLHQSDGIVAFVWLSLPDCDLLQPPYDHAFVFHVFVVPQYRQLGIGSFAVKVATKVALQNGASGVLLATDNSDLRAGFYLNLGFHQYKDDPYLMLHSFNLIRTPVNITHCLPSNPLSHVIRRANVHDLATIQSVCVQNRWICSPKGITLTSANEIEEQFCAMSSATDIQQYLIQGTFNAIPFKSWYYITSDNWCQQILCVDLSESEIRILAQKIAQTVAGLLSKPEAMLVTKTELKALLSY
jgi:hypothetical protein